MTGTLSKMKCPNPRCGAEVIKRVERPVRCPRCGAKYVYEEPKSEQIKEE